MSEETYQIGDLVMVEYGEDKSLCLIVSTGKTDEASLIHLEPDEDRGYMYGTNAIIHCLNRINISHKDLMGLFNNNSDYIITKQVGAVLL